MSIDKILYKKLSDRMLSSYRCFYLWKTLQFARNSDVQDADSLHNNCQVLTNHGDFFTFVKEALISKVIIDLFIFFDPKDEEKKLCYRALIGSGVFNDRILELSQENTEIFKKITKLRHNQFAHLTITDLNTTIFVSEIEELFNTVKKIFSILGAPIGHESFEWESHKSDAEFSVEAVLRDLHYGDEKFISLLQAEEERDLNYPR